MVVRDLEVPGDASREKTIAAPCSLLESEFKGPGNWVMVVKDSEVPGDTSEEKPITTPHV